MPNVNAQDRRGLALAVALLLGVLVALAALLDLGPFADNPLSRADYIARGDEVCSKAHDGYRDEQQTQPKTATEASDVTSNLISLSKTELSDLRDLIPPPELKDQLDTYFKARESGISLLERGKRAADDRDLHAYEAAQAKLAASQLQRARLARQIGFHTCSKPLVSKKRLEELAKPPGSTKLNRPNQVNNPPT